MAAQDSLDRIIDVLPENLKCLVMKEVHDKENFLAVVKGIKGEALAVTDEGVHMVKESDRCSFFPFSAIASIKIYRELRRGKFELILRGGKRPEQGLMMGYEADPAEHVVNFPFAKMAMFKKVGEMIWERITA
ncbi:MAG: hypothetical protein AB1796_01880 [Bacillota bacterium]